MADRADHPRRKQACRGCRRRKKKCDGLLPSCTACKKWGVYCEYNHCHAEPAAALQPTPTSKASAGSTGTSQKSTSPESSNSSWDLPPGNYYFPHPEGVFRAYFTSNREAMQKVSVVEPFDGSETAQRDSGTSNSTIAPKIAEMPPKDTIIQLADIFLDRYRGIIPCFHEQRLLQSIKREELQRDAPVLIYSIIAVAARHHADPFIRDQENGWYTNAKLAFDLITHSSEPALRVIQAAVVLACYAQMVCDFSNAWIFMGKGWRLACSLGLNRIDSTLGVSPHFASPAKSEIEQEERRRTMWTLFIFDRDSSYPIGWAHAIDKRFFAVNHPLDDRSFQQNELGGSAADLFHLLTESYDLLGQVVEHTHILQLPEDMEAYRKEFAVLSEKLSSASKQSLLRMANLKAMSRKDQCQNVWLHVIIHTGLLILHHRSLEDWSILLEREAQDPLLRDTHEENFQRCSSAVDSVIQMIKDVEKISLDLLVNPHIAPAFYLCQRNLLVRWHDTWDPRLRLDIDLLVSIFERFLEVIPQLGQKFMGGIKYDLQQDLTAVRQMRALGSKTGLATCSIWARSFLCAKAR